MRMDEALQGPVVITIEEGDNSVKLEIPRFDLEHEIAFAAEIDAAREDGATRDLDPVDRFKLLSIYPIMSIDFNELDNLYGTPKGMNHVLKTCLKAAGKDDAFISRFIRLVPKNEKLKLVRKLTDTERLPMAKPSNTTDTSTFDNEGSPNPLTPAKPV